MPTADLATLARERMTHRPACPEVSVSTHVGAVGDCPRALIVTCDHCPATAAVLFDAARRHAPVVLGAARRR